MQPGSHGGGFFNDEEELIAAIEREVGPEAAEATRRSLRLASNPRALTDAERAELRANLEPVLQDMRSSGAIVPDIGEEAHDDLGPDCVCAWIHSPGGVGSQGIRVQVSLFAPERLADLADQLQEWEIEELAAAGRPRDLAGVPAAPRYPPAGPSGPQRPGRMVLPGIRAGHQRHRSAAATLTAAAAAQRRVPEVTGLPGGQLRVSARGYHWLRVVRRHGCGSSATSPRCSANAR